MKSLPSSVLMLFTQSFILKMLLLSYIPNHICKLHRQKSQFRRSVKMSIQISYTFTQNVCQTTILHDYETSNNTWMMVINLNTIVLLECHLKRGILLHINSAKTPMKLDVAFHITLK